MKHEEEPVNDYNERMKEYITDLVKQEIVGLGEEKKRDYKKEYAKYGSSTKSKKYRAELNQYNRKKGTYGNGDGKDASHKGGKIVGFEKESTNRGRAEKSRLKKENIPSPSRSTVKKMKKKGNTSVPYGSGYKKVNEFKEMSIKDAFKDLVKSQGKKKALDTLTSVLSGGMDMTPDVKKKFQKKLLKKLSESNFMEYKLKMPVNEVLPKDFFNSYKVTTRNVQKAIQIAKNMKGNMTLAVKKIEKIKKGLSDDSQVMDALRQYNESVDESKELKSKKEGVYEKNKGKTLYGKDLVNYFVKRFKYSTRDATAVANKLKDVGFKVPKVLPFNESVDENILKQIQQAEKIAKSMAGNMTGAVKGIEKIRRGLSRHKRVKVALKKANEGYPGISVKSLHDDEDVAEGKKQYGQKLTDNFFKSVRKFEQEVIVLGKMATKIRGDRTDEKIILKMYKKHMGPFIELIRSWNETTQKNPGISESVSENKCLCEACWKGYEKKGMKKMFGKMYPNCVKKEGIQTTTWVGLNEMYWENNIGEYGGFTFEVNEDLNEAEYQGRKVKLGKIMQGDVKKFKVYVNNPKGNVVKVNFGQGGDAKGGTMRIRKDNPGARKSFRARHNCDSPGPRHKARYWSCKKW